MALFTGISAFPLTPADEGGRLLPKLMTSHLDRILDAGVDSICLLGSTGAYPYFSQQQRENIVEVALRHISGKAPVIVGVGALRTDTAAALARHAAASGADGILLAPISYQRLTEEEVFTHFSSVARAGNLPLCIYNNPSTTNYTFSHQLLARLSAVPNIVAVKMPLPADGDFAAEIKKLHQICADGFSVGYSGDWGCAEALLAGADCWFSAIASVLPEACVKLTTAAISGDVGKARRIDQAFSGLWALLKEYGSFRVSLAIANQLDGDGLLPPLPVLPLPDSGLKKLGRSLDSLNEALVGIG